MKKTDNPDYYKNYCKEWRKKNKEKIKKYDLNPKRKEIQRKAFKNWFSKYKYTEKYKSRQKAKYRINKIFKKYNYACIDCNEKDITKLQIHHLNYDIDKEPEEICILLCGNCHKKRHSIN